MIPRSAFLLMLLAFLPPPVHAQSMSWGEDYARLVKGRELVDPLTDSSFGEQLSLFDGSTRFSVTDVSLPGNSALPVAFQRSWDTQNHGLSQQVVGDWVIDVPNLNGLFVGTNGWPADRCTRASPPPAVNANAHPNYMVLQAWQYWNGYHLDLPGGDGGTLLAKTSDAKLQQPNASLGATSPWTTKGGWFFACLPSVQHGQGEGFVGFSPDGKKYTFDWMVEDAQRKMVRRGVQPVFAFLVPRTMVRIYATKVEDRFGNWVKYDWNEDRLQRIHSNDGRQIAFTYDGNRRLSSVSANERVWTYQYQAYAVSQVDTQYLSEVTLPDGSRWRYDASGFVRRIVYKKGHVDSNRDAEGYLLQGHYYCNTDRVIEGGGGVYVVTHPSGARVEYVLTPMRHGRKNVPENCMDVGDTPKGASNFYPLQHDALTLTSKRLSGPGQAALNYQYVYSGLDPGYEVTADATSNSLRNATPTPNFKTVKIVEPDGTEKIHVFGRDYALNEGRLLRVETRSGGVIVSVVANEYLSEAEIATQNFPGIVGSSMLVTDNWMMSSAHRPVRSTLLAQDGVTFSSVTSAFDAFARPVTTVRSNTLGYGRTDVIEYHDDRDLWVLGQTRRRYNVEAGVVESEIEYDNRAQPVLFKKRGMVQQVMNYHADGTISIIADAREKVTQLSDWKRGIPQSIRHPSTAESVGGSTESAQVNDNGWIDWTIDETGAKTCYGYDAMGRMSNLTYPAHLQAGVCDASRWSPVSMGFVQVNSSEHGLPAGHWRSHRYEGNKHVVVYYDALWRPVFEETYDATDIAGTLSQTVKRYDTSGRLSFQSYPQRTANSYLDTLTGTKTFYDALDRVTRIEQSGENNLTLVTTTEYLSGLRTRVTNPRQQATTTSFMAWDQPGYDMPILSEEPEGKVIQITRHPQFGWPLQLTQRDASTTLSASRKYIYDGHGQLCKTIEPETGASVMGYDDAGNPAWQVSGLDASVYGSTNDCQHVAAYGTGLAVTRQYDGRNRLTHLTFPDGRGNQIWTYEKDSLPASITTYNGAGGTEGVTTAYTYNSRRLLTGESIQQPNWYAWSSGYEYDAIGNLRWQSYPTGLTVDYAPNALGQSTQVKDTANKVYASGVSYHPNGALKQFTYGNGIIHTMQQNTRQLPSRVTSSGGVNDFTYNYDPNGNVTNIWDLARGDHYSRWLTYDNLDRLTSAGSGSFGGDSWHRFTYDALDNLKSWKLAGVKDYADYVYDAQNRLASIRNTAGATVVGFAYDAQGNVGNKNGQLYGFDYGNRLRVVSGKETYRYDGLGRRVQSTKTDGTLTTLWMYSQAGQMLFSSDWGANGANQKTHENLYLAGSVIATVDHHWPSNAVIATKYQHTDALGSPVSATNEAGSVIERLDYEPWGAVIDKPNHSGIGYTGHVMDGGTGLTYMQQRYYDQSVGRFLSVDPVTANAVNGTNFNRYRYAANSPYRFTDPDGRIQRDANGNVVFTSTGESTVVFMSRANPKTGASLTVSWPAQTGYVRADDGTKISASRATGDIQVHVKLKDQSPQLVSPSVLGDISSDGNRTDCHGSSFASGQVWINNDQVKKIVNGDGYEVTTNPAPGDIGIYTSDGSLGTTQHSVTVLTVGAQGVESVSSKGGITNKVETTPAGGWNDPASKLTYYTKTKK
ncbi:MAG: RHS repeat-associated core domain-containing protein [Xanthomonadaceae bacterium]|nr:RHS repeat-associated core domain-containing protein [Xanthomonadaceae bacterium]